MVIASMDYCLLVNYERSNEPELSWLHTKTWDVNKNSLHYSECIARQLRMFFKPGELFLILRQSFKGSSDAVHVNMVTSV